VIEHALDRPELSPRELAWDITDKKGWFISESSVYRILKERGLITSPAWIIMQAADQLKDKTTAPNQMWQSDFTYLKVIGWGWYFLDTVLDDYSRYIIHHKLCSNMTSDDASVVVEEAKQITGIKPKKWTRLLTDNGPCFIGKEFKEFLLKNKITHVKGKPFHPQTQGKIERYHRTMKNIIKLENYYLPEELEQKIKEFVDYYNNARYHESLNNLTPADVYFGRGKEILENRKMVKRKTLAKRKEQYQRVRLLEQDSY
jgi:transposase InsO family protein